MEKTSTGVLSCLKISKAFSLLTVLAKAVKSQVCAVFSLFITSLGERTDGFQFTIKLCRVSV